jgi:TRAP transporter 4TM/12TM fusion protein
MNDNTNDPLQTSEIESRFDRETAFRDLPRWIHHGVVAALFVMAVYHFWAAGFGNMRELWHRGIHIAFVLGLAFVLFPRRRGSSDKSAWLDPVFALLTVAAALYLPLLSPEALAERVGNPSTQDVLAGSVLIVLTLEATRRAVGWTLPLIALIFMAFALFGPWAPGALKHGGTSWLGLVNHLYLTNQGIYGVAIGVMAQYVFLFVVFGVLATRIGLGQLFIDFATVVAGRYSGGPAKVAIFSSAMMGTISGSSIANTVTTGTLTIPAMKKVGYPPHFAGAVEATSSTGGQITPPILGAAAFIMVEYLELPLRDILAAALFPALLHYFGIFIMVHLEARKLGLRGLEAHELPPLWAVLRKHWLSVVPLVLLVYFILAGRTPDFAAVYGIISCIVVGFLQPHHRLTLGSLYQTVAKGASQTLAVGAAAACVGIIVGVVTLTGVGFRLGYVVVQTATDISQAISGLWPLSLFDPSDWVLFFTLVFIALACIVMGAGIPTTATYIILVAVATPALTQLGVEPLVTHFFVFYYGVLADITPPVALAAYAAAGIAGANPFQTGNTAFRLGIAKALVPFVFVYSPSLLLVAQGFSWASFAITLSGAMMGIALIGIAFTGYWRAPLALWERYWLMAVALLFVAPGLPSMLIGMALAAPIVWRQLRGPSAVA